MPAVILRPPFFILRWSPRAVHAFMLALHWHLSLFAGQVYLVEPDMLSMA